VARVPSHAGFFSPALSLRKAIESKFPLLYKERSTTEPDSTPHLEWTRFLSCARFQVSLRREERLVVDGAQ
jgi:hypothetical protein